MKSNIEFAAQPKDFGIDSNEKKTQENLLKDARHSVPEHAIEFRLLEPHEIQDLNARRAALIINRHSTLGATEFQRNEIADMYKNAAKNGPQAVQDLTDQINFRLRQSGTAQISSNYKTETEMYEDNPGSLLGMPARIPVEVRKVELTLSIDGTKEDDLKTEHVPEPYNERSRYHKALPRLLDFPGIDNFDSKESKPTLQGTSRYRI